MSDRNRNCNESSNKLTALLPIPFYFLALLFLFYLTAYFSAFVGKFGKKQGMSDGSRFDRSDRASVHSGN